MSIQQRFSSLQVLLTLIAIELIVLIISSLASLAPSGIPCDGLKERDEKIQKLTEELTRKEGEEAKFINEMRQDYVKHVESLHTTFSAKTDMFMKEVNNLKAAVFLLGGQVQGKNFKLKEVKDNDE